MEKKKGSSDQTLNVENPASLLGKFNNNFKKIGSRFGTDKISQHHYEFYYPSFLEKFRKLNDHAMLEIGIDQSKSLGMWLEYFKKSFVYGVDINISTEGDRYKVFKADQSKRSSLVDVVNNIKHKIFFIIDDGSHIPEHQALSFDYLFADLLSPGGVYIIEDIETSYWTRGGIYGYATKYGFRHAASILELFKNLADDINVEFLTIDNREIQKRNLNNIISDQTRSLVSTITFAKNSIIVTKKTEEEIEYDNRIYRFHEFL